MAAVRISALLFLALIVGCGPVEPPKFLPLTRAGLMEIFKPSRLETVAIPEKDITPEIKTLRAQGDTVWVAFAKSGQLRIATAGDGERIHSLRIWIPLVNNSEAENKAIFASLSALFVAIYPDWPQAKEWPHQSLGSSWAATAREMNPKTRRGLAPGQPDDLIPSKKPETSRHRHLVFRRILLSMP